MIGNQLFTQMRSTYCVTSLRSVKHPTHAIAQGSRHASSVPGTSYTAPLSSESQHSTLTRSLVNSQIQKLRPIEEIRKVLSTNLHELTPHDATEKTLELFEQHGIRTDLCMSLSTTLFNCFCNANEIFESTDHQADYYTYMTYRCLQLLTPTNATLSNMSSEFISHLQDTIFSISKRAISTISRNESHLLSFDSRPHIPDYMKIQRNFCQFLIDNPHFDVFINNPVPSATSMDIFPVRSPSKTETFSNRLTSETLDKQKLIERSLELGSSFLSGLPKKDHALFMTCLLFYYDGLSNPNSWFQHSHHNQFKDYLKTINWRALEPINIDTIFTLLSDTENGLGCLLEQGKGTAFSAHKVLRALSRSSLDTQSSLKLLICIYQCHRLALEETLLKTDHLPANATLFLRDSSGQAFYDHSLGRYLFTDEQEAIWLEFEKVVFDESIPLDMPYFIGWHGTTPTLADDFLSNGVPPPSIHSGDDQQDAQLYVTPDLHVASTYSQRTSKILNGHMLSTPVVRGIFVKFGDIEFETGLPKETFYLDTSRHVEDGSDHAIQYNPSMNAFPLSEEIYFKPFNKYRPLHFSSRSCRALVVSPYKK